VSGADGVVSVVLFEWAAGVVAAASWTQSWAVVRRGHFRIVAWAGVVLGGLAALASGADVPLVAAVFLALVVAYLVVQYAATDRPGVVTGYGAACMGAVMLAVAAGLISGWPYPLAVVELLSGAVLLGAVTNGMLLGHWYLNQPGLKPWALARLTNLSLIGTAASGVAGAAGAVLLMGASTEGAAFGLGAGEELAPAFFFIWLLLVAFTGVVVWMAHRCTRIRSIQSATGLMYVAILTAGVAEFLVRYLMVHAA
jgi:hypothetical protein